MDVEFGQAGSDQQVVSSQATFNRPFKIACLDVPVRTAKVRASSSLRGTASRSRILQYGFEQIVVAVAAGDFVEWSTNCAARHS
jgi:plastocyanin